MCELSLKDKSYKLKNVESCIISGDARHTNKYKEFRQSADDIENLQERFADLI